MGRKPASVAPDQAGQTSLYLDPPRIIALRFVVPIGGVEPDHAALVPEGLEGRLLIVDQRHDDLAIARRIGLADQREVAVENTLVDHRVARNLQRIMLAGAE